MADFTPAQELLITNEIAKIIKPLQDMINEVNAKQASNAETLERALAGVCSEQSARIESMRETGEKYDKAMQDTFKKMEDGVTQYAQDNAKLLEELKAMALQNGIHLVEIEEKRKANDAANVVWTQEAERYINEGRTRSDAAYDLQYRQLDVWLSQQKATLISIAGGGEQGADSSGGKGGSGGGGGGRLCHAKETTVAKLPEVLQKDHFVGWRKNLDLHLETFPKFRGATKLLIYPHARTEERRRDRLQV